MEAAASVAEPLSDLVSALRLYKRNFYELDVLLEFHSDYYRAGDPRRRHEPSDYPFDLQQRLHNWLASVTALVATSRRASRRLYGEHEFLLAYRAQVSASFGTNELAQFVHKLRNFAFHHALPVPATIMQLGPGGWSAACLDLGVLKNWRGWNASARSFIDSKDGDWLDIRQFVSDYSSLVTTFYSWLAHEQARLHADDPHWPTFEATYRRLALLPAA